MTGHLLLALLLGWPTPALAVTTGASAEAGLAAEALYREMDLDGVIEREVFAAGVASVERHGLHAGVVAIADMSQPSTAKRLYIFDLRTKKLALRTLVAHGSNSGGLMAERFSNRDGSHETSLGLYRVGRRIVSPKHGAALLLHGLDQAVNDNARAREVIIHGADYVSSDFVAAHGRLGRSWGCPAVPVEDMARIIDLLGDGGLLYVYGH